MSIISVLLAQCEIDVLVRIIFLFLYSHGDFYVQ